MHSIGYCTQQRRLRVVDDMVQYVAQQYIVLGEIENFTHSRAIGFTQNHIGLISRAGHSQDVVSELQRSR